MDLANSDAYGLFRRALARLSGVRFKMNVNDLRTIFVLDAKAPVSLFDELAATDA